MMSYTAIKQAYSQMLVEQQLELDFNKQPEHPMIDVDGVQKHRHNSLGQPIHHTDEGIKNFHRWFGDSKAVDEHGRPKVFYHGTGADVSEFNPYMNPTAKQLYGAGIYVTDDPHIASSYSETAERSHIKSHQPNVLPIYVKSHNSLDIDAPLNESIRHLQKQKGVKAPSSAAVKRSIDEYAHEGIMPDLDKLGRAYENDTGRYVDFSKHKAYARNGVIDAIHTKIASGEFKTGKDLYNIHSKAYYAGLNETGVHNAVPQRLSDLGFDGIKHVGGKNVGWQDHNVAIAFKANQIKSAIGNSGAFGHPTKITESAYDAIAESYIKMINQKE